MSGLEDVKHVIPVLSGKGGVGKSTVTAALAVALWSMGYRVGVLDIDLTGPSVPGIFGMADSHVHAAPDGWVPVFVDREQRLGLMSLGFLLGSKADAVIWRGPKKTAMIKQFIEDVIWGDLDVLLVDTPPGTSDEHISMAENLVAARVDGAVVVTTPQAVSLLDVRKELDFCKKVDLPVLGIVENMSGYVCPHCADCTNIFSTGGGEALAKEYNLHFLARLPIEPELTKILDSGNVARMLDEPDQCATLMRCATLQRAIGMCKTLGFEDRSGRHGGLPESAAADTATTATTVTSNPTATATATEAT